MHDIRDVMLWASEGLLPPPLRRRQARRELREGAGPAASVDAAIFYTKGSPDAVALRQSPNETDRLGQNMAWSRHVGSRSINNG
jgi:hypothetical protein